jgi:predicted nucleic acid-binding protein
MSELVYVDTNIWIDFIEGRERRAHAFVLAALACRYTPVISSLVVRELKAHNCPVDTLFAQLQRKRKLIVEEGNVNDAILAETLPTHYPDSLHAAIALRLGIPVLTRNVKDFVHVVHVVSYNDIK